MAEQSGFFWTSFWVFSVSVTSLSVFIWLFVKGNKYTVNDAEAHGEEYGELNKEGHGGMTMFLWVTFGLITVWTVYYFVVNWYQFLVFSAFKQ